jgi:hypothetical protein
MDGLSSRLIVTHKTRGFLLFVYCTMSFRKMASALCFVHCAIS